jgi:hypothetical protein
MNFIALKMLLGDRTKYAGLLGPGWPGSGVGRNSGRERSSGRQVNKPTADKPQPTWKELT